MKAVVSFWKHKGPSFQAFWKDFGRRNIQQKKQVKMVLPGLLVMYEVRVPVEPLHHRLLPAVVVPDIGPVQLTRHKY